MRDDRRCYKCGEVGHLRKDCVVGITCDHCGQMGYFRRNCPRAPTCSECGKKGHLNSQCYRRGRGQVGRTSREQELEQEVKKLRAQLGKAEINEDPEKAMMAWEDDDAEEEEDQESEYALVATLPWERADLGLRSGGVDGRKELKTETRSKKPGREPEEGGDRAKRHPEDRLVCHTSALLAEAGSIAVQGMKVDNAIIDTGAQSVLMGRKLAERLRKQGKLETVTKGMLIMTAEGGPPKSTGSGVTIP
ncbi:hypothetical protein CLOP_g21097 [Closterium sp. NIES-67]|nr:hypothetical protein CLOP_g21097 [Closterium sp. NIES-67]